MINKSQISKKILKSGFTLIELLVTIAVIASIMAVLFPNFVGIRQRARDAQRKSDINQLQKALELYKMDKNPSSYPITSALSTCNVCLSSQTECSGNIYIRKIPCDPASPLGGTPTPYIYSRDTDILKYSLVACLENAADPDSDAVRAAACATNQSSITLQEP